MIEEIFENLLYSLDQQGLDEYGTNWHDSVWDSLEFLRAEYANLTDKGRKGINYSDLAVHAAYIFAYAIGRAEFTYQVLKKHRIKLGEPIFSKENVIVTSIGGGPGSEIVGLVKYLLDPESNENVNSIEYRVLDSNEEWKHICQSIVDSVCEKFDIDFEFNTIDLCDTKECIKISLKDNDLIILSFVISEICAVSHAENAKISLREMFKTLSDNAKVFYNDSNAYSFYSFFNESRKFVKGLFELNEEIGEVLIDLKLKETYNFYEANFDSSPHLKSNYLSKFLKRSIQ